MAVQPTTRETAAILTLDRPQALNATSVMLAAPEEVARPIGEILDQRIPFLTGETINLDGAQETNQ